MSITWERVEGCVGLRFEDVVTVSSHHPLSTSSGLYVSNTSLSALVKALFIKRGCLIQLN